jgi:SRSO17 transposase
MLPACRTDGDEFTIPTFDLVPRDVEGFMDELWAFQSAFHDCFTRSEPRAHFFDYMVGQFSQLERKSIEPMALHVEGGTIRGLQRFISDVRWDEEQMLWNYHQLVAETMGDPEGVLMFDETGFVKKGKDSVGVARQYCGTLGKVENCQVGVFAGYASRHGYALVDKRLFLPEVWFTEAYAARRARGQVPPEVTWQSKPQLAAAMLQAIVRGGLLPFKYVVADCLYGNSPDFLDAVDACVGVTTGSIRRFLRPSRNLSIIGESATNPLLQKDSRWAMQRLSRYPRCAQAPSGSDCATTSMRALTSGLIACRSSCPIRRRPWPR